MHSAIHTQVGRGGERMGIYIKFILDAIAHFDLLNSTKSRNIHEQTIRPSLKLRVYIELVIY